MSVPKISTSLSITKKTFQRFFIPALLSTLGMALAGTIDAIVVGRMLGENGLAAVAFAAPVFIFFDIFSFSLSIGGSIYFSQLLGNGETKKAAAVFSSCFWVVALLSVVFLIIGIFFLEHFLTMLGCSPENTEVYPALFEYASVLFYSAPILMIRYVLYFFVRCDDAPRLSTAGFLTGNILDFALNIVFVIGLGLGIKGAAYATLIGAAFVCLICGLRLFSKKTLLKFRKCRFSPKLVGKSFAIGFSSSSSLLASFIVIVVMLNIISRLGSTAGVAVFDVLFNVTLVMAAIFEAITTTLQPLISTYHAERNIPLINATLNLLLKWGGLVTVVSIALVAMFMPQICTFLGLQSADAIKTGVEALTSYLPAAAIMFLNVLFSSYYQSTEKVGITYFITISRSIVFLLFFAFLFSTIGGLRLLWYCYLASELLSLIVLALIWAKKRNVLLLDYKNSDKILLLDVFKDTWDISSILSKTEEFCKKNNANTTQRYYVTLTLEEICSIIFNQAQEEIEEQTYISIALIAQNNGDFTLHLRDNSTAFNPFDVCHGTVSNNSNEDTLDGLGILIVKKKSKSVFYHRYHGFNKLVIVI